MCDVLVLFSTDFFSGIFKKTNYVIYCIWYIIYNIYKLYKDKSLVVFFYFGQLANNWLKSYGIKKEERIN